MIVFQTSYIACDLCGDEEVCNILLNGSVSCNKEECGFPPTLLYANHVGNIYNVGSNICYSCQDGYVNVGGNTSCSRCSETGVWTVVNIQCESTYVCENSWIGHGGHCYLEYTEEEDWCDAQSYCRSHGGYLVSIETESENNFIEGTFPDGSYWIGGNDLAVEGVYVWDSGNALTFANWNVYQPDSYTGDEDCLWANSDWRWHDRKCHRPFKSICEKEPSNSLDAGSTTPPSVSSSTSISTGTVCITTTSATTSTSTTTTAVTTSPTSTSTISTTTSSTTLTTTTTPPPTCPSGWIQYKNHCYLQVDARMTWFDAQSNCNGYSGYLLSIETADECDFIRNDNSFDAGVGWLGGTDADTEGVWMWDSGAEVTLDHWQPYQPDNNYNADCMAVNIDWNSWEWDDQGCHIEYRSVCEIDLANV